MATALRCLSPTALLGTYHLAGAGQLPKDYVTISRTSRQSDIDNHLPQFTCQVISMMTCKYCTDLLRRAPSEFGPQ